MTTAHGRTFEFENFEVRCPEDTEGQWGQDADIVYAMSGLGRELPVSRREPLLIITVGADVADGTTITMPYGEISGRAKTFVSVFITRVGGADELSAAPEESSGDIVIGSASCDPSPSIDIRIDGTLHSEYSDGGKASVVGEVHAG